MAKRNKSTMEFDEVNGESKKMVKLKYFFTYLSFLSYLL